MPSFDGFVLCKKPSLFWAGIYSQSLGRLGVHEGLQQVKPRDKRLSKHP